MAKYKDTHARSITKAVSWRIAATTTTVVIVFFLTCNLEMSQRIKLSTCAGMLDIIAKLILYYLHERVWGAIGFGKKTHPLSSLPVNKPLEEEDLEIIKSKLKDLGYLDED